MAYPNPYNPYQSQYNFTQPMPSQMMQTQQVTRVNGRNGAEAFRMGANSSVLLLDETEPIVWLKQTDGAGYPTLTAYDIKMHQDLPPVDLRSIEERLTKIEEVLKNEPNTTSTQRKFTNDEPTKANVSNGTNAQRWQSATNGRTDNAK